MNFALLSIYALYAFATVFVVKCLYLYCKKGLAGVFAQINLILISAVCLFVLALISIALPLTILFSPAVAWRTLVGIDQAANAAMPNLLNWIFGVKKYEPSFGSEDETVSSVLGKLFVYEGGNGFAKFMYKVLDTLQANHCLLSIENDEGMTK